MADLTFTLNTGDKMPAIGYGKSPTRKPRTLKPRKLIPVFRHVASRSRRSRRGRLSRLEVGLPLDRLRILLWQ